MKRSHAVILCLSDQCLQRTRSFIYPEILDAIAAYRERRPGEIFLIPVRLTECEIPGIEIDDTRTLDRLHFVDLFPPDRRDEGVRSILEALHQISPQPDRVADESPTGCDRGSKSSRGKVCQQLSAGMRLGAITTVLAVGFLVLFLVGRPYLFRRQAEPTELRGYIVDAVTGEPLAGFALAIEDWKTLDGRSPTPITDANGGFRFDNLRPGADTSQEVRLIARKPSYQASSSYPTLGSTTLPIKLRPVTNPEANQ